MIIYILLHIMVVLSRRRHSRTLIDGALHGDGIRGEEEHHDAVRVRSPPCGKRRCFTFETSATLLAVRNCCQGRVVWGHTEPKNFAVTGSQLAVHRGPWRLLGLMLHIAPSQDYDTFIGLRCESFAMTWPSLVDSSAVASAT